jgi:hypothetical protein
MTNLRGNIEFIKKLFLIGCAFFTTDIVLCSDADTSPLQFFSKKNALCAVNPLVFECFQEKLGSFSLLGTVHTFAFKNLSKEAQKYLYEQDVFISESGSDEKSSTDTEIHKNENSLGYRENDNDFHKFRQSNMYKNFTQKKMEEFEELSKLKLSFPHTCLIFNERIEDKEYSEGMDETMENFYHLTPNKTHYFLLDMEQSLESVEFLKNLSYETCIKNFMENIDAPNKEDDNAYPETLETVFLEMEKEKVEDEYEKNFRKRDDLFTDKIINILKTKKFSTKKILIGMGVNHLPGVINALKTEGFHISQKRFKTNI